MITILTATYQCERFIAKCIQSVLKNDFKKWEMLICDDMSHDKTRRKIRQCAGGKIRFLPTFSKLYCGGVYDLLSKYVHGDIVCILDGDDGLPENALATINRAYKKYSNIDYIYTQHWNCDRNLKKVKKGISALPNEGMDLATSWEQGKHCFSHMRTCRSSMLKYRIFNKDLKFSVDKYMGMMLESHGHGGFLGLPLYKYRIYPGQLTSTLRRERMQSKIDCIEQVRKYRQDNNLIAKPIIQIDL